MSGETQDQISGWTVDTLRAHMLRLIDDQRSYFEHLHDEFEGRWTRTQAEKTRADETRVANEAIQRDDDRRMAHLVADTTFAATQAHLDSRRQWQDGHEHVHSVEKEERDRASQQMDRRLEGMNEFRDQLRDQAREFVSRAEFLAAIASGDRAALADHDRLADMVSRQEMNLQFDTLKGQLASVQKSLQDTTQLLATVRSRDAGRSSANQDSVDAAERADQAASRTRTLVLSATGLLITIILSLTGFYIANHKTSTAPSKNGMAPYEAHTLPTL